MSEHSNNDGSRDELLISLLDEKLRSFVKKEEVGKLVEVQVDEMIKKVRAPFMWFLSGAAVVLAIFAIDLWKYDSFARKAFAAAFGINKTIDDRTTGFINDYFSEVDFMAGSFAASYEINVGECESIGRGLPFQSDVDKHTTSAFLSLSFPESDHVYKVTPFVNSVAVETLTIAPKDRVISKSSNFSFQLTDVMRNVPVRMRSSGFIHDYWVRIEVLPPKAPVVTQVSGASRIAILNGLPSNLAPLACPPVNDVIKVRMLVQVSGDPRIGRVNP